MYIVSQNEKHIVELRCLDFVQVHYGATNEIKIINKIDDTNYDILGYCDTINDYLKIVEDISTHIDMGYNLYRME